MACPPNHSVPQPRAASSIHRRTRPPWILLPSVTLVRTARNRAVVRGLRGHSGVDPFAHLYPDPRLAVPLQIEDGVRRPLLNAQRCSVVIEGNENDWALSGLKGFCTQRIARVNSHEYVHAGTPRVDDAGVQVHEFARCDGTVEVQVADVGGHASPATPLRGDGVPCLVYPFQ